MKILYWNWLSYTYGNYYLGTEISKLVPEYHAKLFGIGFARIEGESEGLEEIANR